MSTTGMNASELSDNLVKGFELAFEGYSKRLLDELQKTYIERMEEQRVRLIAEQAVALSNSMELQNYGNKLVITINTSSAKPGKEKG